MPNIEYTDLEWGPTEFPRANSSVQHLEMTISIDGEPLRIGGCLRSWRTGSPDGVSREWYLSNGEIQVDWVRDYAGEDSAENSDPWRQAAALVFFDVEDAYVEQVSQLAVAYIKHLEGLAYMEDGMSHVEAQRLARIGA